MLNIRDENEIISSWQGNFDKPIVSICCITYNHGAYIEDAFKGFLGQVTDFPFEILVHDDCSTDNTSEVIERYEKLYPNLIKPIYQKENQFSKDTRINQLFNFKRALGLYIALCDGDDYWTDSYKLQVQKEFLEKNTDYVLCYSDIQVLCEGNEGNEGNEGKQNFSGVTRDLSSPELQTAPSINTSTAFFRNCFIGAPREFSNSPCSDLLYWSLLGDFGKGKYLSQIKPSVYRVHDGGIHSMGGREKQLQLRLGAMMALYTYRLNRSESYLTQYFLGEIIVTALKIGRVRIFRTLIIRAMKRFIRHLFRPTQRKLKNLS